LEWHDNKIERQYEVFSGELRPPFVNMEFTLLFVPNLALAVVGVGRLLLGDVLVGLSALAAAAVLFRWEIWPHRVYFREYKRRQKN